MEGVDSIRISGGKAKLRYELAGCFEAVRQAFAKFLQELRPELGMQSVFFWYGRAEGDPPGNIYTHGMKCRLPAGLRQPRNEPNPWKNEPLPGKPQHFNQPPPRKASLPFLRRRSQRNG